MGSGGLNYGDQDQQNDGKVTTQEQNGGSFTGRTNTGGASTLQSLVGKKASLKAGSELVKAYEDRMKEIADKDVKIVALDQTKYGGLGYSLLAIAREVSDATWVYGLIALEATGRQSKSIAEMLAVLNSRTKDAIAGSWQICDIFEPDVKELATRALKHEIGGGNIKMVYSGETYIRTGVPKTDTASIDAVYAKIVDACTAEGNVLTGVRLTLSDFVSDGREVIGKISAGTKYYTDPTGTIKKSDARIVFISEDPDSTDAAYRPNTIDRDAIELSTMSLEFDAVLAKDSKNERAVLKPVIIVEIEDNVPAQETCLLPLSALAGVARPGIWMPLMASSAVEFGNFNRICNIISDESGNPVPVTAEDLRQRGAAHQFIWDLTRDASAISAPIFGLRVSLTNPMHRMFRLATKSGEAGNAARERIIELASGLTGGIFPETFPKNKIFLGHITAPVGEMNVKKDVKSLSAVDMAYVIGNANNQKVVAMKMSAMMFKNQNSYIDAIRVLNEFAPQAEIFSRETIVYFNPEFIAALARAFGAYKIGRSEKTMSVALVGGEELNATGSNQAYTNTDEFGDWDISATSGFIGGNTTDTGRVNPFAVASSY